MWNAYNIKIKFFLLKMHFYNDIFYSQQIFITFFFNDCQVKLFDKKHFLIKFYLSSFGSSIKTKIFFSHYVVWSMLQEKSFLNAEILILQTLNAGILIWIFFKNHVFLINNINIQVFISKFFRFQFLLIYTQ